MKLYSEGKKYKLYEGNMLDMLDVIEPNSIDSIVTDPPYGLTSIVDRFGKEGSAPAKEGKDGSFARLSKGFMGKEWDGSGIEYNVETWRKCYTVLKSGGYLLAFGGTRTYHRIACAIEDAGFEIRDTIMWLYGSGFPKSMNIGLAIDKKMGVESEVVGYSDSTMPDFTDAGSKNTVNKVGFNDGESAERIQQPIYKAQNEWAGWGTALKPAYEPIIVARKPCEGSCVDNVLKYGLGGINIDECRVPLEDGYSYKETSRRDRTTAVFTDDDCGFSNSDNVIASASPLGRFPSNVILTYGDTDKDEVIGGMPIEDSGSAARYFYCAKASKDDRDEGLEAFQTKQTGELQGGRKEGSAGSIMQNADGGTRVNPYAGTGAPKRNTHPTVKPCELMRYLIRLVTPKGGTVLDPFNGSGSTGKAVMVENREREAHYNYIGIELTSEYLPIADARISVIANQKHKRRLV